MRIEVLDLYYSATVVGSLTASTCPKGMCLLRQVARRKRFCVQIVASSSNSMSPYRRLHKRELNYGVSETIEAGRGRDRAETVAIQNHHNLAELN